MSEHDRPAPPRIGPGATVRASDQLRRGMAYASRLEPPAGLRRGLGSPALFGIVQGFVAASLYFALGVVASDARGLTWLVFLAAAGFFGLLVLSYVEGTSLHPERGGATVLARYAFNELWSFVAGWAILLDYLILVAICAFAATDYLSAFASPLGEGLPEFLAAAAIVGYVAVVNVRGAGPRRYERAALVVLVDLVLQLVLILLGLGLLLQPEVLTAPASMAGSPSVSDLAFSFTLAIVAFTGLDASSGLAGEVRVGRRQLKRLIAVRLPAAVIPYLGMGLLAASVLPERVATRAGRHDPVDAPVLAIVDSFEQDWIREPLTYLVAASATVVLVIAANAAMLGLSRLGYSLALNRQVPSSLGRLHPTRSTPVVLIVIGALLAVALLVPADLEFLAGLYALGATLAFTLVHLSVCVLRYREPTRPRPFRMPLNVAFRGGELPLPAAFGAVVSALAFVAVIAFHTPARVLGLLWLAFGLVLYVSYRTSQGKPVFKRVTVPERALTRRDEPEAEYGSILVPVLGTPLDDDIMQTAGRLAADENEDEGEGGAVIEALWIFEIPMALPLDAPVSDEQLARARAALKRAKAVGEEYEGVEVATATVRARRAGEAIVREARRRGVEAIVLAAEEPSRQRGGLLLGGKEGLRDTFVGETTRYVVNKAPCRVILTAPPAVAIPGARPSPDPTKLGAPASVTPDGYGPVPPGARTPEATDEEEPASAGAPPPGPKPGRII
jgi:APA family basic amino acid/polyamine antiporter